MGTGLTHLTLLIVNWIKVMTTSGSTNYSTTRDTLISSALRVIGVIAQGETPTTTQVTEAAEALEMLVKAWQADGMPLWATTTYNLTLTSGTGTYRFGEGQTVNTPKPLKIIQAFFHNGSSNVDIPITILTRNEWNRLGNKTTTGQPIQIYYDPQRVYGDLVMYPIPDTTAATAGNHITLVYQRPFEDFDTSGSEPDFPSEWFQALKFGLAEVLAPEYGVPLEQYGYLRKVAKEYKDQALSFGTEEGSFFFEVNRSNW